MKKKIVLKIAAIVALALIVLVLGYLYYVRGFLNTNTFPYDQGNQFSWESKTNAPFTSTDGTGTVWKEKIYIAGGYGDFGLTLNQVATFDPNTNNWEFLRPIPEARNHAMMLSVGEELFVIGGADTINKPKSEVFSYNQTDKVWNQKKPLPVGISAATVQEYGGKIFLFGGVTESGLNRDVLVYDPVFQSWTKISELPTLREHLTSSVLNGEIYIIAGRTGGFETNLDIVEVFNPSTRSWRAGANLNVKRGGTMATSFKGAIYVFGGERTGGTIAEVERFNLKENKWEIVSKMPNPRHGLTVAATGNGIYTVSGGRNPGLSVSNLNDFFTIK